MHKQATSWNVLVKIYCNVVYASVVGLNKYEFCFIILFDVGLAKGQPVVVVNFFPLFVLIQHFVLFNRQNLSNSKNELQCSLKGKKWEKIVLNFFIATLRTPTVDGSKERLMAKWEVALDVQLLGVVQFVSILCNCDLKIEISVNPISYLITHIK